MTKLTRKNFVAWLQSFPPRKVVGRRREQSMCPIARFLKPAGASVTASRYWIGLKVYDLPKWARDFIRTVDRQQTQLTAASCLKALGVEAS